MTLENLEPGQLIYYKSGKPIPEELPSRIKCVQWNIERGYKLPQIKELLLSLNADILCLQELDIGCMRSSGLNTFEELGQALGLDGVFGCEFHEIHSERRNKRTQGGGWHGNAIFSRYKIEKAWLVEHTQAFDWDKRGVTIGEPRRGKRYAVGADVCVGTTLVRCYSLHLELFCGIQRRTRQYLEVQHDCLSRAPASDIQLLFGDLNTMGHGVARFHPRYCNDGLRFRTIGQSEARWWDKHIFGPKSTNFAHFLDPFDGDRDWTLWQVRGWLFRGKLDWTLIRGCRLLDWSMHNLNFKASDHRLLLVEISVAPLEPQEAYTENLRLSRLLNRRILNGNWIILLVISVSLAYYVL